MRLALRQSEVSRGSALAAAIETRGAWPKLERLSLNYNRYDTEGEGMPALARALDSGGLPSLRILAIDDAEGPGYAITGVTAACEAREVIILGGGRVFRPEKVEPKRYAGGGRLRV